MQAPMLTHQETHEERGPDVVAPARAPRRRSQPEDGQDGHDGPDGRDKEARAQASAALGGVLRQVAGAVRGTGDAVPLAVTVLAAGGHLLLEDVPGTGKTLLARSMARAVDASFRRIQATPDLSAGEITGSGIWDPSLGRFTFSQGPLFAHVVLVDEINRTSPRTQAALMEAMDEGAVTVDGVRHPLPDPCTVIATQNPVEQHGAFPLPEGQLDRFMIVTSLGYVDARTEAELIKSQLTQAPEAGVQQVLDVEGWRAVRAHARATHIAEPVLDYAVAVVRATRSDGRISLGASSRAAVALVRAAQARALIIGRDFVHPEDIRTLAGPVLGHRLVLRDRSSAGVGHRQQALALVSELVRQTPMPTFA